ncbi:hypothetical protein JCM11251_001065 [Rhodosporidiobolus azoricus]
MAVKSLPGKQTKPPASTGKASASDATVTRISHLAALLPPSAPASASLNPLADLVDLYQLLSLDVGPTATAKERERNRQEVHTALHTLKGVFEALIKQGRLHGVLKNAKRVRVDTAEGRKELAKEDASVQKVKAWLRERWEEYLSKTAEVVGGHWDGSVRLSALNALMSLVRTESLFLTSLHPTKQARFAQTTFVHVVRAILLPPTEGGAIQEDVKEEWNKWFDRCDDIRYYYLKEAATILSSYSRSSSSKIAPSPLPAHLISNAISTLETLTTMPTSPSELNEFFCATPSAKSPSTSKKRKAEDDDPRADGSTGIFDSSSDEAESDPETVKQLNSAQRKKSLPALLSLVAHRRVFQDCWLAILTLPIREEDSKRVLIMLHRQVLPHMTEPRRLMDWLVDCADVGGTVGILALNGLFTLMTKHGLEFPDFYTKLYSLLDRSVLHVRYRPRFFRLLDIFMSSSHLPATLIASFLKRLSRLSLSASPAAIVTVIPFIYNLLKRHPSCMVLIHRSSSNSTLASEHGDDYDWSTDPFDPKEQDPTQTGALDSSLWEIKALQEHYLASVSGLAKVFSEAMNKQSYAMEDFLDHSYATLLSTELSRRIGSRPPALAPVPSRQPIADSFFPLPGSINGGAPAGGVKATVKVKKVVGMGEDGEDLTEEVEEEVEPVDIVSRLWSF